MSKTRQPGDVRRASRRKSLVALVFVGTCFSPGLIGCHTPLQTHSGDPLYGEYYPKGPNGQPMPPSSPGPNKTTSSTGVPPYPPANSTTSIAAIAGNSGNATLTGGRPLAINEQSGNNWTLTNTSKSSSTADVPASNLPPIVIPIPRDTTGPVASTTPPAGQPQPSVAISSGAGGTIIAAGSWSAPAQIPTSAATVTPLGLVTPEVLQATLQGKGAIGLKREDVPDGVRVSCFVPQRANAANLHYLETVARDYGTALQAILQQIDQQ